MTMSIIWVLMVIASVLAGAATGRAEAVGAAALEGAAAAVSLGISLCGAMCLWSGVMEIMNRGGLSAALAGLLRPILGKLFPTALETRELMEPLSQNVAANMLGLGNAATPMGIKAATLMARDGGGWASDELCRFVVLNTASIQLLPTTVAAVRTAAGSASAFDILPAVWCTSVCGVIAGLFACRILSGGGE
jgi:spore maturation protein A